MCIAWIVCIHCFVPRAFGSPILQLAQQIGIALACSNKSSSVLPTCVHPNPTQHYPHNGIRLFTWSSGHCPYFQYEMDVPGWELLESWVMGAQASQRSNHHVAKYKPSELSSGCFYHIHEMWPVRNVYNAASTQRWIAMACLHGGDSMNEDFADCAKFHRRIVSAFALGRP